MYDQPRASCLIGRQRAPLGRERQHPTIVPAPLVLKTRRKKKRKPETGLFMRMHARVSEAHLGSSGSEVTTFEHKCRTQSALWQLARKLQLVSTPQLAADLDRRLKFVSAGG